MTVWAGHFAKYQGEPRRKYSSRSAGPSPRTYSLRKFLNPSFHDAQPVSRRAPAMCPRKLQGSAIRITPGLTRLRAASTSLSTSTPRISARSNLNPSIPYASIMWMQLSMMSLLAIAALARRSLPQPLQLARLPSESCSK